MVRVAALDRRASPRARARCGRRPAGARGHGESAGDPRTAERRRRTRHGWRWGRLQAPAQDFGRSAPPHRLTIQRLCCGTRERRPSSLMRASSRTEVTPRLFDKVRVRGKALWVRTRDDCPVVRRIRRLADDGPTRSYVACARRAVDARLRKGGIAAARRAKDASRVGRYVQDLAERVGTAPGTLRDAYGRGAVLARGRRFGGRGSRAVASRPGGSVGPRPQRPQAATSEVSTCAPRSDESITDAAESGAHTCAACRRELACDVARHLPDRP